MGDGPAVGLQAGLLHEGVAALPLRLVQVDHVQASQVSGGCQFFFPAVEDGNTDRSVLCSLSTGVGCLARGPVCVLLDAVRFHYFPAPAPAPAPLPRSSGASGCGPCEYVFIKTQLVTAWKYQGALRVFKHTPKGPLWGVLRSVVRSSRTVCVKNKHAERHAGREHGDCALVEDGG